MSEQSYRYFAFISYSHQDKEFAHELQHYLEGYQLPVELCEKYPKVRQNVRPLFRDEENLGAGPLTRNLKDALSNSRFLIVICSEHSAHPNIHGKHYVNDEVYHFLGNSPEVNHQRIIPIIHRENETIAPTSCMPPIMRLLDLLGIDALLKGKERCFNDVVATMLNLDPRELWEHRRRPTSPKERSSSTMARFSATICSDSEGISRACHLQSYLENYTLPSSLRQRFPELPRNLKPIFIAGETPDKSNSSQLSIAKALVDSGYLIIICTHPHHDSSCELEAHISLFLSSNPEENAKRIIPFICRKDIHDEVSDYLPPILRSYALPAIDILEKGQELCYHEIVAAMLNWSADKLTEATHEKRIIQKPTTSQQNYPFQALVHAFRNIFNYRDSSSRKEYWMGTLGMMIALPNFFLLALIIFFISFLFIDIDIFEDYITLFMEICAIIASILCLILQLSMIHRRFRDVGISLLFHKLLIIPLPATLLLASMEADEDVIIYGSIITIFSTLSLMAICCLKNNSSLPKKLWKIVALPFEYLFSCRGTLSRLRYNTAIVGIIVTNAFVYFLEDIFDELYVDDSAPLITACWFLSSLLLFSLSCRRLHHIGIYGGRLFLHILPLVICTALGVTLNINLYLEQYCIERDETASIFFITICALPTLIMCCCKGREEISDTQSIQTPYQALARTSRNMFSNTGRVNTGDFWLSILGLLYLSASIACSIYTAYRIADEMEILILPPEPLPPIEYICY